MSLVKEEVKKLIEELPEEVTWDDVLYEVYMRKKIAAGLKAAQEGRVMSHQDAKKRLLKT